MDEFLNILENLLKQEDFTYFFHILQFLLQFILQFH